MAIKLKRKKDANSIEFIMEPNSYTKLGLTDKHEEVYSLEIKTGTRGTYYRNNKET